MMAKRIMGPRKKVCFEIPEELHKDIKERALFLNLTMQQWIKQAIAAKIIIEDKFK
jgi:hypothetical protein